MNIEQLASSIKEIHKQFQHKAVSAINTALTLRNWLVGAYITEYEQNGEDRAKYGTELIPNLVRKISVKGLSATNLRICRQFYTLYPQIFTEIQQLEKQKGIHQLLAGKFQDTENQANIIHQSVTDELKTIQNIKNRIHQSATDKLQDAGSKANTINQSVTDEFIRVPAKKIISKLSFTHLSELIKIDNPLKRAFYEIECISGTWSVSELKRQISTSYYERSGLSQDKEKLSELIHQKAENLQAIDIIKNPMTFEFLDLPVKDILEESDIEQALIDNLQAFILELGNGFCFEARQKRILIDDEYFYIDLVFYHRILKSHVIIEIKNEKFNHENIGQLDVYLQYYKHEIMQKGDNPPVGILLCTKSKPKMVKYATTNKDNVFVNEFKLKLPSEEEIQAFVEEKMKKY